MEGISFNFPFAWKILIFNFYIFISFILSHCACCMYHIQHSIYSTNKTHCFDAIYDCYMHYTFIFSLPVEMKTYLLYYFHDLCILAKISLIFKKNARISLLTFLGSQLCELFHLQNRKKKKLLLSFWAKLAFQWKLIKIAPDKAGVGANYIANFFQW